MAHSSPQKQNSPTQSASEIHQTSIIAEARISMANSSPQGHS